MATLRQIPYSGMNFVVDIQSGNPEGSEAGLSEVVIPEARLQIQGYRNGNDNYNEATKLHTVTHYENLILRRGAIGSLTWYNWWNSARNGDSVVARNILVQLISEDRSAPVLTWKFLRAQPVNYYYSALNALAADTLIESLELSFDRMELE